MKNSSFFDNKTVHLIGIGGIGMSAIAEVLHRRGVVVQGSDVCMNYMTERLIDIGIKIFPTHDSRNIDGVDLVVRSTAISENHIEITAANNFGIQVMHRAQALAELLKGYKTIAVTGTHGKSTTTALVGTILLNGNYNPLIVNGAFINQLHSNVFVGNGNVAIIESDESDESFLILPSDLAIVTNMDPDHLDYYGSTQKMIESYRQFILKTLVNGICFICVDHKELVELSSSINHPGVITYGINSEADITAHNIRFTESGMLFDVRLQESFCADNKVDMSSITDLNLSLYGLHNVYNALAAAGIALTQGVNLQALRNALSGFQGVKRRFSKIGYVKGACVYDDYAHHPSEIKATLSVAKELSRINSGSVIAVVQPHRYSRLSSLFEEFAESFFDADLVILIPVYSAGEKPINGYDSNALQRRVMEKNNQSVVHFYDDYNILQDSLNNLIKANDIIIFIGAGDVNLWSEKFVKFNK